MLDIKKSNHLRFFIIILWFISVFGSYFFLYSTYNNQALQELGNKATIAAVSVIDSIPIDNTEKTRLLSLDFENLLVDEQNVSFEEKARKIMEISDIKYIYVQLVLPDENIKYYVTKDTEEHYGASLGTPLKVVYYLDAVVDNETRMVDTDGQWYKDQDRYTVLKNDLLEVLENKKNKVFLNNDEWGSYISSYVPIFSESGDVVGVIGADLFIDTYNIFTRENYYMLGLLAAGNITLLFLVIYLLNKRRESNTDYLTKVMNRKKFMDNLMIKYNLALKGKLKFTFVFLDIDFFKEYNDYYGHQAGDLVLYNIGKILKTITGRFSGISGRYGGDEFTLAFLGVGEGEIEKIINEIFQSLEEYKIKTEFLGPENLQTLSIGASFLNHDHPDSIEELIKKADEALYLSKNHGRNMAHFHDGIIIKKFKRLL